MDRAGLITLEQARAAGLSFDEPEPRACPHCGAALEPLGAALAGRVAWVSAAPCPCEGASGEREAEARRRAALAAKEEAARREKALSRAGIPRRYWAAEADRPEFAEYIASFAGNGGAGLYIHGGVGAGKTHAASAMARLFAEAGYDVAFTTAKGMLERVKATFDEGGTEAAVARYAKCDVLVLDDLGNIGTVPDFERVIATARSRNVSFSIILQSASQLERAYKKEGAKTILDCCDTVVFLGGKSTETNEMVSKMVGKQTVKVLTESDSRGANRSTTQNYNVIERDLMTPDEVGRLPRDESIVLISGTYPLKGAKYRIEEHPSYPEVDPGHAGARHEERFDFKEYRERRGGDAPMR